MQHTVIQVSQDNISTNQDGIYCIVHHCFMNLNDFDVSLTSVIYTSIVHRQPFEEEIIQYGHTRSDSSDKVNMDNKMVFGGKKHHYRIKMLLGCRQKSPSTQP